MNLKWTPQAVKQQVITNLVQNAEIVGQFVESDARRRLLAIQEGWGQGHRNYVSRLLTNIVEVGHNEVVISVGLPPGKTTAEGKPTRHLGFYIEMGDRHHAAHPFVRPAVFENAKKIIALLEGK